MIYAGSVVVLDRGNQWTTEFINPYGKGTHGPLTDKLNHINIETMIRDLYKLDNTFTIKPESGHENHYQIWVYNE